MSRSINVRLDRLDKRLGSNPCPVCNALASGACHLIAHEAADGGRRLGLFPIGGPLTIHDHTCGNGPDHIPDGATMRVYSGFNPFDV